MYQKRSEKVKKSLKVARERDETWLSLLVQVTKNTTRGGCNAFISLMIKTAVLHCDDASRLAYSQGGREIKKSDEGARMR